MMFLQFFIWGAWYVTVGNYMNAHEMGNMIFWAYTVGPIAAIVSPFFLGMIADRFFATERVLGVMHILGGITMFLVPWAAGVSDVLFIVVLLLHMLCYMPTLGLTNTLAFHNITNQEKQFPIIRVFGTIGWIAANWVVSKWLHADKEAMQFYVTGGACIALGLYSFSLPHTPPPAAGKKIRFTEILGIDALRQLSSFPFYVFLISSFLICIPLAAYYNYAPLFADAAGFKDPAFSMSFGQIAEIVFMIIMPFFFIRLGVKWMLLIGMAAWVVRYGLFAGAADDGILWMIFGGILLHGICYDFFFVTGFIYTDKKSTPEVRGQAQGLLVFVTQGLGMLIGAQIAGRLFNGMVSGEGDALRASYQNFWLIPCIAAGVIMVLFFLLFRDKGVNQTNEQ
ncbi:MAG: MFS transporter [Phycisphaerales bacterium]|nr:MFS transporter [Phycisphaerales bacterium]